MSYRYSRLDERPVPVPKEPRRKFNRRSDFYNDYPSLKRESNLSHLSIVCYVLVLVGIVLSVLYILAALDIFRIDWSFIPVDTVRIWMESNIRIVYSLTAVLCAIQAVLSFIAAMCCSQQEHYRRGLVSIAITAVISLWTIIITVISVVLIIFYISDKRVFFN